MRYLPHSAHERAEMLGVIGAADIEALFSAVPKSALKSFRLDLPDHSPEFMVEAHMRALANKNQAGGDGPFFVGAGAYRHHVPATVDHLIQRSEWLTAYTPYQPEISQGTLQMLFEFQTQVAKITGMDVANASLYDGSTGTAEAVLMARRFTRRNTIVVWGGLLPRYPVVVRASLKDDADPVGLSRLARGLVELGERWPGTPLRVVLNQMRPTLGWTREEVGSMIGGFVAPASLHFLPEDRAGVDRALVAGRTLLEAGESPLTRAVAELADALVGTAGPAGGGLRRRRAGRARLR